ncbi:hypothetical protein vseg_016605 [Gypsophila vaccaria]
MIAAVSDSLGAGREPPPSPPIERCSDPALHQLNSSQRRLIYAVRDRQFLSDSLLMRNFLGRKDKKIEEFCHPSAVSSTTSI